MIVEIVVVNGRADLGHVGGKNASPTIYLGSGHGIIGGGSAFMLEGRMQAQQFIWVVDMVSLEVVVHWVVEMVSSMVEFFIV